jgi:uncharacterized membrane protein
MSIVSKIRNFCRIYIRFLLNEISLSRAFWLYGNVILAGFVTILIILGLLLVDDLKNFISIQKFTTADSFKKSILHLGGLLIIVYTIFITYVIFKAANRYQGARKYFYGAKIMAVITAFATAKDIVKYFF